jgi:hypothetical protein
MVTFIPVLSAMRTLLIFFLSILVNSILSYSAFADSNKISDIRDACLGATAPFFCTSILQMCESKIAYYPFTCKPPLKPLETQSLEDAINYSGILPKYPVWGAEFKGCKIAKDDGKDIWVQVKAVKYAPWELMVATSAFINQPANPNSIIFAILEAAEEPEGLGIIKDAYNTIKKWCLENQGKFRFREPGNEKKSSFAIATEIACTINPNNFIGMPIDKINNLFDKSQVVIYMHQSYLWYLNNSIQVLGSFNFTTDEVKLAIKFYNKGNEAYEEVPLQDLIAQQHDNQKLNSLLDLIRQNKVSLQALNNLLGSPTTYDDEFYHIDENSLIFDYLFYIPGEKNPEQLLQVKTDLQYKIKTVINYIFDSPLDSYCK